MRLALDFLLGGLVAAAVTSAACAQAALRPAPPASAASGVVPSRNAAVMAAENAKEPGAQRPEERVVPQLSVPLQSRKSKLAAAAAASAPAGNVPGTVNDAAARCLAARDADEKAACERRLAASAPR
jgi:hypothetical protein